jgi:hypothetical protein
VNGSLGEPKAALGQFDHGIRLSPVDPFNLAMLKGSARALFLPTAMARLLPRALMAICECSRSLFQVRMSLSDWGAV